MQSKHNKNLVPYAKQLRKEMTKEERHLWYDFLRQYPVNFSRQKVLGRYIADFYCRRQNWSWSWTVPNITKAAESKPTPSARIFWKVTV